MPALPDLQQETAELVSDLWQPDQNQLPEAVRRAEDNLGRLAEPPAGRRLQGGPAVVLSATSAATARSEWRGSSSR
jgi:hypothetical protein